jgi:uncharacterized protein (TIGR03435 family)
MLRATLLFIAATGAMPAQTPAYEVASIKPNLSAGSHSSTHGSTGQIVFTNVTLKRLIERAYKVKPFEITGPAWIEDVAFDITAKYPSGIQKEDDRTLMLRTLLTERFKLVVHRETKSMSGYALVSAKNGFRLQPVEPGGNDTHVEGGRVKVLTAKKISMDILAGIAADDLGETVVDQTGIAGVYDLELRWTSDDTGDAPSLFTALQDTLGLRLQPQKVPVEIVVVDHVERVPTEN